MFMREYGRFSEFEMLSVNLGTLNKKICHTSSLIKAG